MRKHDVRKWLHAILDLLPVIIIPVFMIYSHRHQIDSYSINVAQNEIIDFNQVLVNGDFHDNVDNWQFGGNTAYTLVDSGIELYPVDSSSGGNRYMNSFLRQTTNGIEKFYLKFDVNFSDNYYLIVNCAEFGSFTAIDSRAYTNTGGTYKTYSDIYTIGQDFHLIFTFDNIDLTYLGNIQLFNLTQMFGSGNEPTKEQFDTYFTDNYYDYTLSHKELLKNVGTITYDDTDIGSQMLYCLYNSVDKYFNLNNVFGFNNVYDWLSLNIFNGNPPIAIYIVWNIALYEFLMDLIMLLYALFMWFIDMCENLIDRSFHVASGRKK